MFAATSDGCRRTPLGHQLLAPSSHVDHHRHRYCGLCAPQSLSSDVVVGRSCSLLPPALAMVYVKSPADKRVLERVRSCAADNKHRSTRIRGSFQFLLPGQPSVAAASFFPISSSVYCFPARIETGFACYCLGPPRTK